MNSSPDIAQDIADFQQKVLGNAYLPYPAPLTNESLVDQLSRIKEEVRELDAAVYYLRNGNGDQDKYLAMVIDALIDGMYFAAGWLYQMGVPLDKAWNIVHAANMKKVRGVTKRGQDNDAAKPEDWVDPVDQLADMIRELRK